MKEINCKSDFEVSLRLKNADGETVPFPDCDWSALFWTATKANAYTASCIGGRYVNCYRHPDGAMRVVFDSHRMGCGTLHWEPHFSLPSDIYPDGALDLFRPCPFDIRLVPGAGSLPMALEVEAQLPYVLAEVDFGNLTLDQRKALRHAVAGEFDFNDDFNDDFSN